jgi:serine/threonine-protein kinase RsbT
MSAFALFHQVEPLDVESMMFALGEALANAIEHAAQCDEIEVGLTIDAHALVATVTDRGPGFKEPPRTVVSFPEGTAESGRGIPIMQRCTDFFNVRTSPGDGTLVTLGRYRRDRQREGRYVS